MDSKIIGGTGGGMDRKRGVTDFYPTPPEVTQALLDYLQIPKGKLIWEPACGEGDMVMQLMKSGYLVYGSDISSGADFLTHDDVECDWIITNPPFSLSEEFVRRCWATGKPFALLLKSQYWHAGKRLKLFEECKPSAVLPLTWRPDFLFKVEGKHGAPLMDVLWVVWDRQSEHTIFQPLGKPGVKS